MNLLMRTDLPLFLRESAVLKRIAVATTLCALAGLLYSVVAPKWYRSVLTIVPSRSQRPGFASILGGELGGLAAGLDVATSATADIQRIAAVLHSNGVTDAVIEKFALRTRYGETYQEHARDALWRHCEVKPLPKPTLVELSCEDKDPRFVQALLSYFAEYGNQVFRRVSVSSAAEQVRFLERRVAELRQQADESASRMRAFQELHQVVDLETQTKAVVSAMASLQSQRINKELELDYARTFSSHDEATLQQLRSQLAVIDDKLRDLGDSSAAGATVISASSKRARTSPTSGVFPPAMSVPKLRAEFETLLRDRKVSEATLIFALERLEGARADEARDTSTFHVLDPPALPTRHARPRLLLTTLLLAFFGLFASGSWEWWRTVGRRLEQREAERAAATERCPECGVSHDA